MYSTCQGPHTKGIFGVEDGEGLDEIKTTKSFHFVDSRLNEDYNVPDTFYFTVDK